jgi:hypothetical protein
VGNNGKRYKLRERIIMDGREDLKCLRVPCGASCTKKDQENGNEVISFYEKSFDGYEDILEDVRVIPRGTIKIEIDTFFS